MVTLTPKRRQMPQPKRTLALQRAAAVVLALVAPVAARAAQIHGDAFVMELPGEASSTNEEVQLPWGAATRHEHIATEAAGRLQLVFATFTFAAGPTELATAQLPQLRQAFLADRSCTAAPLSLGALQDGAGESWPYTAFGGSCVGGDQFVVAAIIANGALYWFQVVQLLAVDVTPLSAAELQARLRDLVGAFRARPLPESEGARERAPTPRMSDGASGGTSGATSDGTSGGASARDDADRSLDVAAEGAATLADLAALAQEALAPTTADEERLRVVWRMLSLDRAQAATLLEAALSATPTPETRLPMCRVLAALDQEYAPELTPALAAIARAQLAHPVAAQDGCCVVTAPVLTLVERDFAAAAPLLGELTRAQPTCLSSEWIRVGMAGHRNPEVARLLLRQLAAKQAEPTAQEEDPCDGEAGRLTAGLAATRVPLPEAAATLRRALDRQDARPCSFDGEALVLLQQIDPVGTPSFVEELEAKRRSARRAEQALDKVELSIPLLAISALGTAGWLVWRDEGAPGRGRDLLATTNGAVVGGVAAGLLTLGVGGLVTTGDSSDPFEDIADAVAVAELSVLAMAVGAIAGGVAGYMLRDNHDVYRTTAAVDGVGPVLPLVIVWGFTWE